MIESIKKATGRFTIVSYSPNIEAPKYIKQILTDTEREISENK